MLFGRRKPKVPPPLHHATHADFDAVVSGPGIAVVDFWAPWCGPCRMMEPILGEIAVEYAHRDVRVVKVNVDEAPDTAAEFGIRSIPTLVVFRHGEPLYEMVGLVSKPVLERELAELLGAGPPGAT